MSTIETSDEIREMLLSCSPPTRRLDVKFHGLVGVECEPMDQEMSKIFVHLVMAESVGKADVIAEQLTELNRVSLPFMILHRRLEIQEMLDEISPAVLLLVGTLLTSPGDATLWGYTLHYIYAIDGVRVDMPVFTRWFPAGFPTQDAKSEAWQAQKMKPRGEAGMDNLVDYPDMWPAVISRPPIT